jgi:hypothetical protein
MGSVIGELLAAAVVIAAGPTQVIAVILLLLSRHAIGNSVAFLVGWLAGLSLVSIVALIVELPAFEIADGNAATLGGIAKLLIGLGLVVLAARQWRSRPLDNELAKLPGWMALIERVGPSRAVFVGLLLSIPNLKVILLTLAVMLAVIEAGLSAAGAGAAIAAYVLVASSTVIAPVVCNLVLGERAAAVLIALRTWLERNYATMTILMLLAVGVVVAATGLGTLATV